MKFELLDQINENIYAENPDDPSNPEVLVDGVGRYELIQVTRNVKEKIADLAKTAAAAETADDWERVKWMVDHGAMNAMIETIVSAKKELEERSGERDELADVPAKGRG